MQHLMRARRRPDLLEGEPSRAAERVPVAAARELQVGLTLLAGAGVLVGVTWLVSPGSASLRHLLEVTRQAAPLGMVTLGQMLVMLTSGIDLSVGEVLTLVNILASAWLGGVAERAVWVVPALLLISVAIGTVNGLLVERLRVPAIIATLAMGTVLRGAYLLYTGGLPFGSIPRSVRFIGVGRLGGIFPVATAVWLGGVVAAVILLRLTAPGRMLYHVGSNRGAARLSGLRAEWVAILAYQLSALSAAVAGLIISGYLGTGYLDAGATAAIDSLTAAVIGGVTFAGGEGTVEGAALGAFIMQLLANLMTVLRVPHAGKLVIQGAIIALLVVGYSRRLQRR